ncbi:31968_t:CDS:1, partial [Racocetra persica]
MSYHNFPNLGLEIRQSNNSICNHYPYGQEMNMKTELSGPN